MSSRTSILASIRQRRMSDSPLPEVVCAGIEYPEREKQFADTLAGVGGQAVFVSSAQLRESVAATPAYQAAKRIVSLVPGLDLSNVDGDTIDDPHELADVDLAILPGTFAIAENGAVWCDARGVKHRTIYCLAQHLLLVVPRRELLDNLHQAYQRLSFPERGYGLFISGPSKTADIEQSLVIGAHGARSLHVFLASE